MDSDAPKLVLASGSPRRRSLLDAAGLSFSIVESRLHERRRPGESGEQFALRMANDKATAVSRRIVSSIVLGADTIVELDGNVLGKPKDAAEAHSMLRMLSGRTHTVVTAFAIARGGEVLESAALPSRVTFHELREDQIAAYIASGDPFDKAGSYGIQDGGAEFIATVEGSRDNVMGLPVREVIAVLARHGIRPG